MGVLDLCDVEAMGDRDEAGNNLNTILGAYYSQAPTVCTSCVHLW